MLGFVSRGVRALRGGGVRPSSSLGMFSSSQTQLYLNNNQHQGPFSSVVSRYNRTWTFNSSPISSSASSPSFSLPNLLSSSSSSSSPSLNPFARRNYSQKNEEQEKTKEQDKKQEKEEKNEEKEEKEEEPRKAGGGGKKGMNFQELAENILPKNPKGWMGLSALVTAALFLADSQRGHNQGEEVTLAHFVSNVLPENNIPGLTVFTVGGKAKKNIVQYSVNGRLYRFEAPSQEVLESVLEEAQLALDRPHQHHIPIYYREITEHSFVSIFHALLLLSLVAFTLRSMSFGGAGGGADMGGLFQTGKNPAKMYNPQTSLKVKFKEVAGLGEAKTEVMEFVSFLKNPKDFQKLGAKIPRGALFVGPPGTGKTMLAKATAAEAGTPFFSVSGSDFVELYGGNGPARVRALFAQARKNAPCLIFIDEIDAIGKKRSGSRFRSNDERENTLNQLLVEMDGFETDSGVVVLGGTNIPDILDPALLRPGRFDRRINVDLPDIRSRKEIFMVYLKKIALSDKVNAESVADRMAAMTAGLSGADIANICNEAALRAGRNDEETVTVKDLEVATERVLIGLERRLVLSHEEKRTIAYHEAGHAVMGWFLEHTQPLMKVSIIPRGQAALGYAQYIPKDQYLYTKAQIEDIICMALGGRIAEEVSIGKITTGARDDLDRVTKMSYSLVTKYGMGKIGPVSFRNSRGEREMSTAPYSDFTANEIDEEVRGEVRRLYQRSKNLIVEKKEVLTELAEELLKKEVLTRHQVAEILGPRPYETKDYALEMYDRIMEEEIEREKKEEVKKD